MSSVVILGGGISGLLAAYALRRHRPVVVEASASLGGAYTAGGLKYIRDTVPMRRLLSDLGLKAEAYRPRGAVLIDGKVLPHPEWLVNLPEAERAAVQLRHWTKTRGSSIGFTPTCMNDPAGEARDAALKVDHAVLLQRLASAAEDAGATFLTSSPVIDVTDKFVSVRGIGSLAFKRLVTTLALPLMAKLAPGFRLPPAHATQLTVASVAALPPALRDAEGMDYIYTPDLPLVHRISPSKFGWQMEAAGKHLPGAFAEALPGWGVVGTLVNIPGHLLPLEREPQWPHSIEPLGRYATWDSRSTAEKVWAQAHEWEKTWPA